MRSNTTGNRNFDEDGREIKKPLRRVAGASSQTLRNDLAAASNYHRRV